MNKERKEIAAAFENCMVIIVFNDIGIVRNVIQVGSKLDNQSFNRE